MRGVPCVLMRGGSSKGLFFLATDLPADAEARDRLLLAAMGSPDRRQIDGLGGGDDQTSKVMIVSRSHTPGVDIDYQFGQVSVARGTVDLTPTSGNMLAAVAPFAIDRGLLPAADGRTTVRMQDRNSGHRIDAVVRTPGGRVAYQGDFRLDGVPGTGAPIRLHFTNPAGRATGRLLPTGRACDTVDGVHVTCIDFANPMVMVAADAVGKTGYETKAELDRDAEWLARLETLRQAAARLMGIQDAGTLPKVVLLAPPRAGGMITSRYFTPGNCHAAHALTGALGVTAACHIPGSVAAEQVRWGGALPGHVVIEHPAGMLEASVGAPGAADDAGRLACGTVAATARPLFSGEVLVRASALSPVNAPLA
ncbi:MAG: PrpF domain-containing protein [Burkholderiales bacterium]